jgi:hypothetical protein
LLTRGLLPDLRLIARLHRRIQRDLLQLLLVLYP